MWARCIWLFYMSSVYKSRLVYGNGRRDESQIFCRWRNATNPKQWYPVWFNLILRTFTTPGFSIGKARLPATLTMALSIYKYFCLRLFRISTWVDENASQEMAARKMEAHLTSYANLFEWTSSSLRPFVSSIFSLAYETHAANKKQEGWTSWILFISN